MLKNLKNAEFSKKLLVFIQLLIIAVFVLVCISVFRGDSSPLTALITGVFSLASLSFGFYYWKAKNENIRKYAKKFSKEEAEIISTMYKSIMKGGDYEEDI